MSTTITAARIYEYGEPDVFRFETMDVPDPVGHEVLVRNTVIGLNFVDIYYRRGTLPVPEFPAIIGDEASGVVEAVGSSQVVGPKSFPRVSEPRRHCLGIARTCFLCSFLLRSDPSIETRVYSLFLDKGQ